MRTQAQLRWNVVELLHPKPGPRALLLLSLLAGAALLPACDRVDMGALAAPAPPVSAAPPREPDRVIALGRLEPEDGVIRVAGPSAQSVVIQELLVDEGDWVSKGQVIALLDTVDLLRADAARLEAEHANARRDLDRNERLYQGRVVSDSQRDSWQTRVLVTRNELRRARAELERASVKAPIDGQVLYVHARPGELVGPEGILELGRTDSMFAIAEVYEEDIGRIEVGQRATITSPVLPTPMAGTVEWINLKVAKQDTLGTDPAARKDARVVEVEIRLDHSDAVDRLTNLQVDIEIEPSNVP